MKRQLPSVVQYRELVELLRRTFAREPVMVLVCNSLHDVWRELHQQYGESGVGLSFGFALAEAVICKAPIPPEVEELALGALNAELNRYLAFVQMKQEGDEAIWMTN